MKILQTLFLLCLSVNYAIAEDITLKKYDVEIIIFEDAHARYLNSEAWDKNTGEAVTTASDSSKRYNLASYKTITPSILASEYKRLNHSSEYKVLLYSAWRQTGLDKSKAYNIRLDELTNKHKSRSSNSINGDLKVVLARYLHFYSELYYQRKKTNEENLASEDTHKLKVHRRMRSKELHYIDHPLVGILIQINPVQTNLED